MSDAFRYLTIWGQVGIASGISIGDKTTLYAQSGVGKP
jgi:UDP-3-O-[3-hydroxymyristoyl] glucosamine N-acyltransferase